MWHLIDYFGDPRRGRIKSLIVSIPPDFEMYPENRTQEIKVLLRSILPPALPACVNLDRPRATVDLTYIERLKGLEIVSDSTQPTRVNILMPGLLSSLTGGPLCIFQLAQLMSQSGLRIRILLCQNTGLKVSQLTQLLPTYRLGDLRVEWVDYPQLTHLKCHPRDLFMGTLYSMAVVAYATQRRLNQKPFLYMIQDFEPYFFEHGSDAIEAYYSYDLPHLPIYNSHLLEKYFQVRQIGNYSPDFTGIRQSMNYFPTYTPQVNWIPQMSSSPVVSKKRLIVYARPHAQRNGYKFTISCLWKAVEEGLFPSDQWEIYGVG